MSLPLAVPRPDPRKEPAERPLPRVLVVDDDRSSRERMVEALRERGYALLEATDGPGALAALRAHRPDLLVMDVEMPGLGGVEVCRIVKANQGEAGFGFVPVILVTASQGRGKVEGLELGADDYLVKPFVPEELAARVTSMLRLKALHDALLEKNRELARANLELEERRRELLALSRTDPLTGVANRRSLEEALEAELQRAGRFKTALSLLMLDVDHFKALNDTFGHPFGDRVLCAISVAGRASLRQIDLLARYGGEEFIALLPGTGAAEAAMVAERLRAAIAGLRVPFVHPDDRTEEVRCTASLGRATSEVDAPLTAAALLASADAQLYAAKQAGRNRVFPPPAG